MQFTKVLSLVLLSTLLFAGCAGSASTTSEPAASDSDATSAEAATDSTARSPELASAVEFADRLVRRLDAFEAQRQETRSQIQSATESALSTLSNEPAADDLRAATRAWRTDWNAARTEVRALDRAYSDVEAAAVRYFHHLERQTSRISNDSLRSAERSKNERLEMQWQNATVRASGHLTALRHRLRQGNDLYVTMLNASLRSDFGENVDTLQQIDARTTTLLEELRELSKSGQRLVIDDDSDASSEQPATADTNTADTNTAGDR